MKYIYKTFQVGTSGTSQTPGKIDELIAEKALEGWQFVSLASCFDGLVAFVVFKREQK